MINIIMALQDRMIILVILLSIYYRDHLVTSQSTTTTYMTHSTGGCTVAGKSSAPVVEQYTLSTCFDTVGPGSMQYTTSSSTNGLNLLLTQKKYPKNSACTGIANTTVLINDPYQCTNAGIQGAVSSTAFVAPSNVYAMTRYLLCPFA